MQRRQFVKSVAAVTSLAAASSLAAAAASITSLASLLPAEETTPASNGMIYRKLGRTGERVSAIGLGGYHLGQKSVDESEAIRLIHQAVDRGINFLDNCWDYNGGVSEVRMGKALAGGYRSKVFLMTKFDGRTKAVAARQIDESLRRLATDHIDLMQIHEVIRLDDADRVLAEGGAMEALNEAKQAGKIRYIGFTGHKDPLVHLRTLEEARKFNVHFDTVQMPLNVMDAHFRSFGHDVLPVLVREGIAPLGMKAFGDHYILESKTITPIEGLHYCLNLPISVQITGIDNQQVLDQAFEAARTFKPMTEAQVSQILAKTREAALNGRFELYKVSAHFDGTAANPQWLG